MFSDPSCTQEVARIPPSVTIAYVYVTFATTGGALISRLRELGDPIAVTDFYYSNEAGSCAPHAISDGATFRAITDREHTVADFVRIRRLPDSGGDRFVALRDHGDDGMVVAIGFHDAKLGLDCSAAGFANVPPECGVHATFVATDQQLFAIGAPFTATAYTISTADICAPTLPLPNLELHELGPSIAVSDVGTVSFGVLP